MTNKTIILLFVVLTGCSVPPKLRPPVITFDQVIMRKPFVVQIDSNEVLADVFYFEKTNELIIVWQDVPGEYISRVDFYQNGRTWFVEPKENIRIKEAGYKLSDMVSQLYMQVKNGQ